MITVRDIVENVEIQGSIVIKEDIGESVKTVYMEYDHENDLIGNNNEWMDREVKYIYPITTMLQDYKRKLHQTAAVVLEI